MKPILRTLLSSHQTKQTKGGVDYYQFRLGDTGLLNSGEITEKDFSAIAEFISSVLAIRRERIIRIETLFRRCTSIYSSELVYAISDRLDRGDFVDLESLQALFRDLLACMLDDLTPKKDYLAKIGLDPDKLDELKGMSREDLLYAFDWGKTKEGLTFWVEAATSPDKSRFVREFRLKILKENKKAQYLYAKPPSSTIGTWAVANPRQPWEGIDFLEERELPRR